MKKLMLILLVGLGLSISAQSQTRCSKDTTQLCSMESTKSCKKDSIKECSMNVTEKNEINIENNYHNYDDVYYSPYGYYGTSWLNSPWYWSYPINIDQYGRKHRDFTRRHKEFIGKNKNFDNKTFDRKDNKSPINQHRSTRITDGQNRNESSMYARPQMRGEMRSQLNRSSFRSSTPQMRNNPPMQQSRPMQHYSAPPTQQRQSIRRGPSAEELTNEELMNSLSMEDFIKYINYKE